jgi:hypothetical protein
MKRKTGKKSEKKIISKNKVVKKTLIKKKGIKCNNHCDSGGAVYGLGFIGSFIYYLVTATGFWMGVWGFLKALLWPAFLIYELMKFLGM